MMKSFLLGLGLGVVAVGASISPTAAEATEVRAESISVVREVTAGTSAPTAPVLEGAFSFQTLNQVEAASADASEEPSAAQSVVEVAEADVSEKTLSSNAPLGVVGAVSTDTDIGTSPRNNIVPASGLKRGGSERRPVVVLADATTIPRPSAEGLTPREAERLESFDKIWKRLKRQQIEGLEQTSGTTKTPQVTEEKRPETPTPEAEEEAKQEEATSSTSTENSNEADVLETQEEPASVSPEGVTVQDEIESSPLDEEIVEPTVDTGEIEATKPETAVTLGTTGIGGEEAAFEAALGFTQGTFGVTATSFSPLNEEGLTVVNLESTFSVSENTSLRLAANDALSDETSFDVGTEAQVLPDLTLGATFEDLDDVKVNLETAWQASETVLVALEVDGVTAGKVVNFETTYTHPDETFAVSARANDALRPAKRTFDLEATYKVNAWTSSSLSVEAIPDPAVEVGAEFQLNRNSSLGLSAEDIFGNQTYGAELQLKF